MASPAKAPAYIVVGHFRIDKNDKLGHGSYGNVYRAVDCDNDQPVAAKEIYLGDDDEEIED